MNMKRLIVLKTETITELIERVLADPEGEITLVIPKGAKLKTSADSFSLLARETATAKKHITIESVDDEIRRLAAAEKLTAVHPLFDAPESQPARSFSDIVPASARSSGGAQPAGRVNVKARNGKNSDAKEAAPKEPIVKEVAAKKNGGAAKASLVSAPAAPAEDKRPPVETPAVLPAIGVRRKIAPTEPIMRELPPADAFDRSSAEPIRRRPFFLRPKVILGAVIVLVIAGAGAWVVSAYFGRAAIDISFKTVPWQYQGTIVANKATSTSTAESAGGTIPAEIFYESRNLTKLFPATGKSQTTQKATGKLTIYNTYSTASQSLVASTRFETPDGKIFRLTKAVVVPGAKQKGSTLTPSTVVTTVTADAAGDEYNLGAVDRLTIPGFKGTPKYTGFYGALPDGTSGGSTVARPVATDADVADAKQKVTDILNSSLETTLQGAYAKDFKILDGTSGVTITKLDVNQTADKDGNFSVFSEAKLQAIGFRESDVQTLLLALATKDNPGLVFKDVAITYPQSTPDLVGGTLTLTVAAQGNLTEPFSANDFKAQVLGKGISEVRRLLTALPGISDANLSLWPRWLSSVPGDPKRVTVTVR